MYSILCIEQFKSPLGVEQTTPELPLSSITPKVLCKVCSHFQNEAVVLAQYQNYQK